MMKNVIKDALVLFAITLIAGLLLALVNEVTKEPIAKAKEKAKAEACKAVFEDADSFVLDEEILNQEASKNWQAQTKKTSVDEIYKALDKDGIVMGFVISLTSKEGYGGEITFMMGIRNDRTINGLSILSSKETVGLGQEADKVLCPQFKGKNVEHFTYTKMGSTNDSEIDAISSATITTNAFVNSVNAGLDFFENILVKEGE